MEMNDYQYKAGGYRMTAADLMYALLGLSGEVGELHSHVAKKIRDGGRVDPEYICKELGDVLWFVAAIAADYGHTLDEIAHGNLSKLAGRKDRGTITGSGDDR